MISVSPSKLAAMPAAYAAMPTFDADALPAWQAFRDETRRQLDALMSVWGLDVLVDDTDPYASAAEMMDDVKINKRIRILGTHVTGGHPYLADDDNDAFRAVHDVVGHFGTGRGFDRHGEEAAYLQHARYYSPLARRALVTETRGQNAAMIASGGTFDVQRIAIMPAWCLAADALAPTAEERDACLAEARAFHAAAMLADA